MIGAKKNDDEKSTTDSKHDLFLSCGREPQLLYEQFRLLALDGGDVPEGTGFSLFKKWGMTLFLYGYCKGSFWTVTRVRAPVRAGDFSLKELLLELGIQSGVSQSQKDIIKQEVCL
jgi:hypothetical protein